MKQPQVDRANWLIHRWLVFLLGIFQLVIGQWRFNNLEVPDAPPTKPAVWLNEVLHLGIHGVDNILSALPYLFVGGVLLAISLRGISLMPANPAAIGQSRVEVRYLLSRWPWLLIGSITFLILILQVDSADYFPFQIPVWLASLFILAFVVGEWDRKREVDLSPHLSRTDWVWLTGLMGIGIVLGVYHLQGFPDQLMGDEGNFWTIARSIADGSFRPSIFAPGVYSFPIFSSMIQAWFLKLFGIDMWGWRLGSVIMGMITVPPLYLLVREAYDRTIAVMTCSVLISSPYFVDFSRLGYNNIQALFFITLTLYWLYIGVQRKSNLYLFLAGGMAGMGFYTYFAARFGIVIALAYLGLLWLGRKIRFREMFFGLILIGVGFAMVVIPYIVHGLAVDPQGMSYKMWESVFFNTFNGLQYFSEKELFAFAPPFTVNGNVLFYNPKIYLVLIARGLAVTLIIFQRTGIIAEHFIAFPLAGTFGALFYLVGLALTVRTIKQPRSLLLFLWFISNVVGLSAFNTVPPRHTHMLTIIPAIALLTGVGLHAVGVGAAAMHQRLRKMRATFLGVLTLFVAIAGLYDFFERVPKLYFAHPDQVMSWAGLISKGESFAYLYADPLQKDFEPYVMQEFRLDVDFESIAVQEVLNGDKVFSAKPMVVFYPPEAAEAIARVLKDQWGEAFRQRIFTNSDTDGVAILAAGMNTPFEFERDKTFLTVLLESYGRPALWPLLIGLLVCFMTVAYFPAKWIPRMPPIIQRIIDWFNAPASEPISQLTTEDDAEWTAEIQSVPDKVEVIPDEEAIGEPPQWAQEQGFAGAAANPDSARKRFPFFSRFKPVRTENGTDFYIQVHIPKFNAPKNALRWSNTTKTVFGAISFPSFQVPGNSLLFSAIVMAILGQILIVNQMMGFAVLTYLASAAGLFVWAFHHPKWRHIFADQLQLDRRATYLLLGALIIVTIATRFFDLNSRVYGLEADETKWTVQAWYTDILHADVGEFGTVAKVYLPVDFWVRSLFLRIFGLSFISARIESVVLSLISVICLYLLVRLLTSSAATGLLSALLFSLSFIELNASHQALHNTPPLTWTLAAFAMLFIAIRNRKLWQFQIAGVLLGLGMLTYDTFYPSYGVALFYLIGLAMHEIKNRQASVKQWATILILVAWPLIVVYFSAMRGLWSARQQHLLIFLQNSTGDGQGLQGAMRFLWTNTVNVLKVTFSGTIWEDSLIHWSGPLLNPLLLPFVVIGLAYNLWNIRRPHFAFIPLWYALHTFTGPILIGAAWGRVMYLAVPPLIIWGALGLWTALAAVRAVFDTQRLRMGVPIFGLLLVLILLNDYRIFATRLIDPEERQKRRELADLTMASAKESSFIIYPFKPNRDDSVLVESHVLIYSVAGARGLGLDAANHYKLVDLNLLLPELWLNKNRDGLDVVFDKTSPTEGEERQHALDVVVACYPASELKHDGRFFDIYHFSPQALQSPKCYSAPAPNLLAPQEFFVGSPSDPVAFQWDTADYPTLSFDLTLERKRNNIFWLEAESAFKGSGWIPVSSFVNEFTGSGFLLDDWKSGEALHSFVAPQAGPYRVWVRSYKRVVNDQHNFISIKGQPAEFALNEDPLNQWVWRSVGVYDLPAAAVPLSLTRTYGVDEQYSVFVDTVVITPDLEFTPDLEDGIWDRIVSSGEINSSADQYVLPRPLASGDYRWRVRVYDGVSLIDGSGARGVASPYTNFTIP